MDKRNVYYQTKTMMSKEELIIEYNEARNNFIHYSMEMKYGDIRDIVWNFNNAKSWDKIIKNLREELLNQNTDES